MSNRLYLVCSHCPDRAQSFALGERGVDGYRSQSETKGLQKWFDAHRHCGNNHDHFTVAYDFPKNHDMKSVEAGVHKALRVVQ